MDEVLVEGIVRPVGWSSDRLGAGDGVPWPVPLARLAQIMAAQRQVLLNRSACDDRASRALLLAAHHFAVVAAAIAEVTLAVARERETGLELTGVPEIGWLRGGEQLPQSSGAAMRVEAPAMVHGLLRRIARTASWTSAAKLPFALLRPDAIAVTHNGLLREAAVASDLAIGFRHADEWVAKILGQAKPASDAGPALALADAVAEEIAQTIGVDPDLEARAARLLAARLRDLMIRAWRDLCALESARLPDVIWSGSGGNWPARALGIEVMRRGGTVRRFDHGGGLPTLHDPLGARLIELSVSTDFVAATESLAGSLRKQVAPECQTRIEGASGDPHYRRAPGPVRHEKKRPRVMYVTGIVSGFRRLWPLQPSDVCYIDWQLRVARALKTLDVDLVLKPHPEGLYRGRPHPLSSVGSIETRPFEAALDDVDVAIFDFAASTTFWVAVTSRCKVVLLDMGLAAFDAQVAPLIEARAAVVPVRCDDQNRFQVDINALDAAIRERRAFDHEPLRSLMAGNGDASVH